MNIFVFLPPQNNQILTHTQLSEITLKHNLLLTRITIKYEIHVEIIYAINYNLLTSIGGMEKRENNTYETN